MQPGSKLRGAGLREGPTAVAGVDERSAVDSVSVAPSSAVMVKWTYPARNREEADTSGCETRWAQWPAIARSITPSIDGVDRSP